MTGIEAALETACHLELISDFLFIVKKADDKRCGVARPYWRGLMSPVPTGEDSFDVAS
jgi:hypothetical protein